MTSNPGAGEYPETPSYSPARPDWINAKYDASRTANLVERLRERQAKIRKLITEVCVTHGKKEPDPAEIMPFLFSRAWGWEPGGLGVDDGTRPHANLEHTAYAVGDPPGDLWFVEDDTDERIPYLNYRRGGWAIGRSLIPRRFTAHVRVWNTGKFAAHGVTVRLAYWVTNGPTPPLRTIPRAAALPVGVPVQVDPQPPVVVTVGAGTCDIVPGRLDGDRFWAEVQIPFPASSHMFRKGEGWVSVIDCPLDPCRTPLFDYLNDRHVTVWTGILANP